MNRPALPLLATLALGLAAPAVAADDPALAAALARRFDGDRTGACVAAAVIEDRTVRRATVCADPARARALEGRAAFEIGSVSKTMAATLLARLIDEGRASLDDPLARHLPPGTVVPTFEGAPILLRHLVTHTSGLPVLPPDMAIVDPEDPYAAVTPEALLAALERTRLERAPGTRPEYSNFAMMLLSYAITRAAGQDLETLMRRDLFEPLGMRDAHIARRPDGVRAVQGHLGNGRGTPPWRIPVDLAGVGGVRATLDDMVRYVHAQLHGSGDARLDAAIARTHAPIPLPGGATGAMNWMRQPLPIGTLFAHEGGTGGFSTLVAFVPETRRGVVLLSDTALNTVAGLGMVGLHLLDPASPMPGPRRAAQPPAALLDALAGEYRLEGGPALKLWADGGRLHGQADGQPALEFGYDDTGDFYALTVDAVLSPRRQPDGRYAFSWSQGGGVLQARRTDPAPAGASPVAYSVPADVLDDYPGTYPLVPGFALTFSLRDGRLFLQGTGQPAIAVDAVDRDVFSVAAVGAELRFERGAGGAVRAVTLRQNGQVLRGERAP